MLTEINTTRQDAPILSQFVRAGSMNPKQAEGFIKLPLLILLGGEIEREEGSLMKQAYNFREKYITEHRKVDLFRRIYHMGSEFYIMKEFVTLITTEDPKDSIYIRIRFTDQGRIDEVDMLLTVSPSVWYRWRINESDDDGTNAVTFSLLGPLPDTAPEHSEKGLEIITQHVCGYVINIMLFLYFCNERDKYCVAAKPLKMNKNLGGMKGRLNVHAGPRIVYLDRLPREKSEPDGVNGSHESSERKPHHRKGSYRTLRAERYRNHPKYGIEKAIYVKPAWIGDRTAIVNGTTYDVLDN